MQLKATTSSDSNEGSCGIGKLAKDTFGVGALAVLGARVFEGPPGVRASGREGIYTIMKSLPVFAPTCYNAC